MGRKRGYLLSLLTCFSVISFLAGCNDDAIEEPGLPANISVVAIVDNEVIQIDVDGEPDNITTTNVNTELGIDVFFVRLKISPSVISFCGLDRPSVIDRRVTVWDRNILTGVSRKTEIPLVLDENEFESFVIDAGNKVAIYTNRVFDQSDQPEIILQLCDKSTLDCQKVSLGTSRIRIRESNLLAGDRLLIYHFTDEGQFMVSIINLITSSLEGRLTFNDPMRVTTYENELFVFNTEEFTSYDLTNLQELRSGTFQRVQGEGGVFQTPFASSDLIQLDIPYAQPFELSSWPGLFDLSNNNVAEGSGEATFELATEISERLSIPSITFTTVEVDPQRELLVYGYISNTGSQSVSGVAYANWEGELLTLIPMDFIPERVLIR